MATNLASRFAPNLALPPYDGGAGDAGMAGPDSPRYDRSGNPLPYFNSGVGPRQYFGAQAPAPSQPEANAPIDNSGAAVPYLQNQGGPRQYFGTPGPDGLRGLTPPAVATPGPDGLRGRIGLDPDVSPPQDILGNNSHGPRVVAPIPVWDPRILEDRIVEGIRSGRIDPITPDRVLAGVQQQGPTLEDLLSHFNFQLPKSMPLPRGTPSDLVGNPNNLSTYPNFATQEGLAEFNRRMGLNLGPQMRTQEEQDRLVRGGYTTARVSQHTLGHAADIHPRDIGGLTGQAAVNEVRRRAIAAGYDVGQMRFIWETGRGRNQGTGPHVHMQYNGTLSQ